MMPKLFSKIALTLGFFSLVSIPPNILNAQSVNLEILSSDKTRPENLDDLLKQQAVTDRIMFFLKEQLKDGTAETLIQKAEQVLKVKYKFLENKHSRDGKVLADFLTDAKKDEKGEIYKDGRVDVYDGGQIPDTMYSTYYEVYSEGAGPKYIDLIIKYERSSGMPCLSGQELSAYARLEGYEPNGGTRFGTLDLAFFKSDGKEMFNQLDDSGEYRKKTVIRYYEESPHSLALNWDSCAKKIGIRINY